LLETRCDDTGPASPLAFIIDDEVAICRVIEMFLAEFGIAAKTFHTAGAALAAFAGPHPQIVFLDIALAGSDAVHVIEGLRDTNFAGMIQVITGGNPLLVKVVERIGTRHGLAFLPPLQKPFRREAIRNLIASLDLGGAARTDVSRASG
jgi:DNA-binding NtrC family response regulator